MIYILSNIFFGHPKLSKYQIDYFDNYFLPMVIKNKPEKIIITGNIFYNTNLVSFKLLNDVISIFSNISDITIVEIIENDYCFQILEDCGNLNDNQYRGNIINNKWAGGDSYVGENIDVTKFEPFSLFHFSKENKEKIGFHVIQDDKIKFIENNYTPRFVEYNINSLEDLNININNDFIDLTINSELILKPEYKNKIDIFLNNNSFNNVFYTEKNETEKVKIKNNDIRNILIDNIDDNLKEELNEIFHIYDDDKNQKSR